MDNDTQNPNANTAEQNDICNLEKLTQSYLLLKQKVCRTHDLIKQYNDKLKECERLKSDLDAMNKQTKKVTCNYNTTLSKVIKLELQNTDYKKNIETLSAKVAEHEIKMAADKQHIQQLVCKIKDIEEQHIEKIMQFDLEKSSLQVKVKELEQELKVAKKSYDTKIKKMEKKICTSIDSSQTQNSTPTSIEKKPTSEIGVNTISMESKSDEVSLKKTEVAEKCTMTNEFYSIKDDIYPLFCAKCETLLKPPPLEKICRMMTNDCPKLVEKISSPSPQKISLRVPNGIPDERCKIENVGNSLNTSPLLDLENRQTLDFTNVSLHSPIALNQMNFPTDVRRPTQISTMMNRHNYYIGSTGVTTLPSSTPSATNQSSQCVDVTAVASSLSIMNSLQKRIDTLESKIKKQLKHKSVENSNCCQYKYPLNYCGFNPDSNLQSNITFELWKRMLDVCNNKQKDLETHERCTDVKANKHKFKKVKLKYKKRLQQGVQGINFRNAWKVETIATRQKRGPLRKKTRKQKTRHFVLKPADIVSDNDEDFAQHASDSDSPFLPESEAQFEQTATMERHSPVSNITTKSVGTETDSGVLSDSVESNRPVPIETETNTHSDLMDSESGREKSMVDCHKNVDSNNLDSDVGTDSKEQSRSPEPNIRSKIISTTDTSVKSTAAEKIRETVSESTGFNSSSYVKTNKYRERNKCDNREVLLKKLRNLKRNSKGANIGNATADAIQISENETPPVAEVEKQLHNDKESDTVFDNYIPKKRPRIAHTPKTPTAAGKVQRSTIQNTSIENKQSMVLDVNMTESEGKILNGNVDTEFHQIRSLDTNFQEHIVLESLRAHKDETPVLEEPSASINYASNIKSVTEHCGSADLLMQKNDNATSKKSLFRIKRGESSGEFLRIDPCSKSTLKSSHSENVENNDALEEISNKNTTRADRLRKMDHLFMVEPQINKVQSNTNISNTSEKLNPKEVTSIEKKENKVGNHVIEVTSESVKPSSLLSRIGQYTMENKNGSKKNQDKQLARFYKKMDKFVKSQLQRLVDSDWETAFHNDVLQKLKNTCSPRIIAKCIVEFISTDEKAADPLDQSHTPPAPLMTRAQQKIITLIIDLHNFIPTIIPLVQASIEYELFRLNISVKRSVLDSLTRMYTALARVQKDRERVRIFCCDALYCLGLHAITVLYIVLTSWPEVFPTSDATNELLPRCMAHLIVSTQQATTQEFPKLKALKQLVQLFYQYKTETSQDILKKCLTELEEKPSTKLNTAIVLLAKREGTSWANKYIIKDELLPMIVSRQFPDAYGAFHLLGNLMRAFPTEDKDNTVGKIVEQLCDLVESGEGPEDQQEGVISALLSLSRHKFQEVSQSVIKWKPKKSLHPRTVEQFNGFLKQRTPEFWKSHLKKNKSLLPDYKTAKSKT